VRSDPSAVSADADDGAAHSDPPDWLVALVEAAHLLTPESLHEHFRPPSDGSGRPASVLVAFCETPFGPAVLLTERALGLRSHAGQAAFPGGGAEPDDADTAATAIREAGEEVGLDPTSVRVLGQLPQRYLPPSQYLVTPVIAWWARPHPVGAVDVSEVARAVVVTIADLVDPANRFVVYGPRSRLFGPGFEIDDLFIWGMTAALLDELLRLGGWEVPWDHDQVRELPVGPTP
jgi:8-oxo-dGTP pyrophosphatase MutT (NUDIX family)